MLPPPLLPPAAAGVDPLGVPEYGNGVDGVRGVAMYRPPHLGHLPGSSPACVVGVWARAAALLPPRRGW